MELKKLYYIKNKIKRVDESSLLESLYNIIREIGDAEVYLYNCWSSPYTKSISLIIKDLELAFKVNNYNNINIILASDEVASKLLRQEWIREYFAKQMPPFMIEEILGLIRGGEKPEDAWKFYIDNWLPDNTNAKNIIKLQEE